MTVITSTGVEMAISTGRPTTIDAAGFAAKSYTDVGEVTDIPEYGPTIQVVTHEPLATGITEKYPGFINYGSQSIALGWDISDAGQALISAAANAPQTAEEFSVRISYPTAAGTAYDYYVARVFSYTKNPSASNSIVGSTVQVEINSVVINVPA